MARIVPARPRGGSTAEEAAINTLEAALDDSFVVLQRGPAEGSLVVLHPDLGACAVACAVGPSRWDADMEAWIGADAGAAARTASKILELQVAGMAFLPDMPPPGPGAPGNGHPAAFTASGLAASVVGAMAGSVPPGPGGIDNAIQAVSPGAASYVRGDVTDAQKLWREERGPVVQAGSGGAFPVITSTASAAAEPTETDIASDDPIILLLRQAAETVSAGRDIFVHGVAISPQELTEPDFLLPALLLTAAEDWAPVVVKKAGKGGFHMRLRTDRQSILGYRLTALEPSAPMLLMLPVLDRIRRSVRTDNQGREEILMDETVRRFARWLEANRLNTDVMGDIDMRIALGLS